MITARKTGRQPTRRPRTNHVPTSRVLAWGLGVTAAIAAFLWFGSSLFTRVPLRDYSKLYVSVRDVGNMATHDPVRVAGVRVGQVLDTSLGSDGRSRLELQLEPGVKVPVDSKIVIRANGLLGARYVELTPGRASHDLPDAATLRAGDDALTYGLPEALATFDKRTRDALGTAVGGLGQGLLGRGMGLNDTLHAVADAVPHERRLIRTLNSAPQANAALIPSLRSGMSALDANGLALGRLLDPTAEALAPFSAERRSVQATLDAAPGALTSASVELRRGRRLLGAVRSLASAAKTTLHAAPAGLRGTARLLAEARAPLARTGGLLRATGTTVSPLLRLSRSLDRVLRPLEHGFASLAPTVEVLGKHGCDVQNFATTWRSMTQYGGTGEGPAGTAMGFRLQAIPPGPLEAIGAPDQFQHKDPYPAPCRYAPSVYPQFNPMSGSKR